MQWASRKGLVRSRSGLRPSAARCPSPLAALPASNQPSENRGSSPLLHLNPGGVQANSEIRLLRPYFLWRPAGDVLRTFWSIHFIVALSSNSLQIMKIHEPIRHELTLNTAVDSGTNPIPQILEWKTRLDNEPQLTVTEIAKLNGSILEYLQAEQNLDLSVNQLRKLSRLTPDQQTRHFQTLQDSLCSH